MATDREFPVVGIGASAGGVEAFEGLFRAMPSDTGMAFVLVTHMPRGHETTLPEIVARYTTMPAANAGHQQVIEADHVYVCPPDHVVTIQDGRLMLEARAAEIHRRPIDVFLSSLAEARGENAIGVILSGGGSDGALGIKAIKERGGLTVADRLGSASKNEVTRHAVFVGWAKARGVRCPRGQSLTCAVPTRTSRSQRLCPPCDSVVARMEP